MKLFIIGNGFDLAHKLPTEYWCFRKYLCKYHYDFLRDFEQHYSIYPGNTEEEKRKILWNCFETNLANIDEEIIVEDAVGIDMNLDGGNVGIVDILYDYFKNEYKYIESLADYLKSWVRGIKIKKAFPITSKINNKDRNYFITFNYTSTLEKIYGINYSDILHIHGSLYNNDPDPIIGHGNTQRIKAMSQKKNVAENNALEKEISIYEVIGDYYKHTFKDVSKYMHKLWVLNEKQIDEIDVIGHSISGVDLPYFRYIDSLTKYSARWNVFFYKPEEETSMKQALLAQGIDADRIKLYPTKCFYDLQTECL